MAIIAVSVLLTCSAFLLLRRAYFTAFPKAPPKPKPKTSPSKDETTTAASNNASPPWRTDSLQSATITPAALTRAEAAAQKAEIAAARAAAAYRGPYTLSTSPPALAGYPLALSPELGPYATEEERELNRVMQTHAAHAAAAVAHGKAMTQAAARVREAALRLSRLDTEDVVMIEEEPWLDTTALVSANRSATPTTAVVPRPRDSLGSTHSEAELLDGEEKEKLYIQALVAETMTRSLVKPPWWIASPPPDVHGPPAPFMSPSMQNRMLSGLEAEDSPTKDAKPNGGPAIATKKPRSPPERASKGPRSPPSLQPPPQLTPPLPLPPAPAPAPAPAMPVRPPPPQMRPPAPSPAAAPPPARPPPPLGSRPPPPARCRNPPLRAHVRCSSTPAGYTPGSSTPATAGGPPLVTPANKVRRTSKGGVSL